MNDFTYFQSKKKSACVFYNFKTILQIKIIERFINGSKKIILLKILHKFTGIESEHEQMSTNIFYIYVLKMQKNIQKYFCFDLCFRGHRMKKRVNRFCIKQVCIIFALITKKKVF